MQASDKALGLETLDMDERLMDQGVLQHTEAGVGAGTALDDGDMHRMGKVQELKACLPLSLHRIHVLTFSNREIYDLWLH